MAVTETQVAAAELEKVRTTLPTLFERDGTWFASIEKRPVEVVSNISMRIPLEALPGGRFGHYNPAGGDLGRGDGPTLDKGLLPPAHLKYAVEYQHLADIATDEKRKAVVQYVRRLVAKSMAEVRRQIDALSLTAGDGVLATISAVATAGNKDTYTLQSAGDGFQERLLRYGTYYSVYVANLTARRSFANNNGTALGGEAKIDLYDDSTHQVRFSETIAAPAIATDKIVVSGLTATPPVSILGLPYHHSDASSGLWLGIDRSIAPYVRANRVNASGGLSLSHARLAINKVGNRIGMDNKVKAVAWMHPCQAQAYEELGQLVSIIQKSASDEKLNLYFGDNLQMAGAAVRKHYSWDKTRIDFVVGDVWGRGVMEEIDFYRNRSGGIDFEARSTDGGVAAANIFYIVTSFNEFVDNPPACSYISNLTIPAGYAS